MKVWIARDKDGELNLFTHKPHRCTNDGFDNSSWDCPDMPEEGESEVINYMEIDDTLFPELTWEDDNMEFELKQIKFKL